MQLFDFFKNISFIFENTENTSKQRKNSSFCEQLLGENEFEAVSVNFCFYEYGMVAMLLRKFRRLAQGHWNCMPTQTKTANFIATPIKKHI